jgi:hypothetical protein
VQKERENAVAVAEVAEADSYLNLKIEKLLMAEGKVILLIYLQKS